MQKLIDLVLKYRVFIAFVALVVISLSLISMGGSTKIGGFRSIVIGGIGWMQSVLPVFENPEALKSENRSLRELNLKLSNEVTRMRDALLENKNLRQAIQFKEEIDDPYVIAEVVGKSTIELRNYITVNKGKQDGVQEGMAVRTDAGLVGVVIGVSNKYSFIELIANPDVKIAGLVQSSHIDGIVVWEGGETFRLKNIPKNSGVEVDDILVTSNLSNKYPERIPIGKIITVDEDPGSIFLKIYIKPYVNFSTLDEVFILKYLPDPEIDDMINKIEARLKARKEKSK